jgi:hypothetical protein
MTRQSKSAQKSRNRFLEAVEKELIDCEIRERELSRREKQERADELCMPALKTLYG